MASLNLASMHLARDSWADKFARAAEGASLRMTDLTKMVESMRGPMRSPELIMTDEAVAWIASAKEAASMMGSSPLTPAVRETFPPTKAEPRDYSGGRLRWTKLGYDVPVSSIPIPLSPGPHWGELYGFQFVHPSSGEKLVRFGWSGGDWCRITDSLLQDLDPNFAQVDADGTLTCWGVQLLLVCFVEAANLWLAVRTSPETAFLLEEREDDRPPPQFLPVFTDEAWLTEPVPELRLFTDETGRIFEYMDLVWRTTTRASLLIPPIIIKE